MTIERVNPAGLMPPQGYTHVVIATGGKTIYVAGQAAFDEQFNLVGPGDHYAQAKQAFKNLAVALAAAGATPEQVVKCTMYVVGLTNATLMDFARAMEDALDGRAFPPTASTLVGVERLAFEGMLVEIDAIAVV